MIVAVLVAALLGCAQAGPLHASCKIDWSFSLSCSDVQQKLVDQIAAWKTADNCAQGGEKCLYSLTSRSTSQLKAKHETPVKHYVDDLTFTFTAGTTAGTCNVHGYSTSETWYAILDYSTNYCNLHNLVDGAGLTQTNGFTETTSNSVCTQYSSRNCAKY